MADVTDERRRWRTRRDGDDADDRGRGRDRGQLLLVTALALAVVLISLSFILNSAIYAENLAARESDVTGASFAAQSVVEARDGVGGIVRHINRNATAADIAQKEADLTDATAEWQRQQSRYVAFDGARFDVSLVGSPTEGVRVADDNASSAYLPRNGTPTTWRLAENSRLRNGQLTVNRTGLVSLDRTGAENVLEDTLGDGFIVRVHNATVDWRVVAYVNTSSNDVEVMSYETSEEVYRTCSAGGQSVSVDLTSGRLDGRPCRALSAVSLDATRNVTFVHGEDAAGTYSFVFDRIETSHRRAVDRANHGDQCTATFYDSASDSPYTSPALYAATADLDYAGPTVTHETQIRIAPEEQGPAAAGPTIEQFDVSPPDGGTTFEVDWAVSDPDGDLGNVAVTLEDLDTSTTNTTWTNDTGESSLSEANVPLSTGDGGTYDVRLYVEDDAGNTRTVTVTEDNADPAGCPV